MPHEPVDKKTQEFLAAHIRGLTVEEAFFLDNQLPAREDIQRVTLNEAEKARALELYRLNESNEKFQAGMVDIFDDAHHRRLQEIKADFTPEQQRELENLQQRFADNPDKISPSTKQEWELAQTIAHNNPSETQRVVHDIIRDHNQRTPTHDAAMDGQGGVMTEAEQRAADREAMATYRREQEQQEADRSATNEESRSQREDRETSEQGDRSETTERHMRIEALRSAFTSEARNVTSEKGHDPGNDGASRGDGRSR